MQQVNLSNEATQLQKTVYVYRICQTTEELEIFPTNLNCPSIFLERYFVFVVIFCFILSIVHLALDFGNHLQIGILRLWDIIYHTVSSLMMIIAGILYIISAKQIYTLYTFDGSTKDDMNEAGINLLTEEKFAAGVCTQF